MPTNSSPPHGSGKEMLSSFVDKAKGSVSAATDSVLNHLATATYSSVNSITHSLNEAMSKDAYLQLHAPSFIGRDFAFLMNNPDERELVLQYYNMLPDDEYTSLREERDIDGLIAVFRPEKEESNDCGTCTKTLSIATLQLYCYGCQTYHCKECVTRSIAMLEYGFFSEVHVCEICYYRILEQRSTALEKWIVAYRVHPFLQESLSPYPPREESRLERSDRYLNHYAVVGKYVGARSIAQGLVALSQFGRFGLLAVVFKGQLRDMLEMLSYVFGLDEDEESKGLSAFLKNNSSLLFAGYYQMTWDCETRGNYQAREAIFDSLPEPDTWSLENLRRYSVFAHISYQYTAFEVQLLLSTQLGFEMIHYRDTGFVSKDAKFGIFANRTEKIVVLAVRGTKTPGDIASDLKADTMELPLDLDSGNEVESGANLVHSGIGAVAMFLVKETQGILEEFSCNGYKVVVVGHSLGAAVGSLVTLMLSSSVPGIHCYAYGCPPCVSGALVPRLKDLVTTAITMDDIVPRLKLSTVKKLITKLKVLDYKQDFDQDFAAFRKTTLLQGGKMQRRAAPVVPEETSVEHWVELRDKEEEVTTTIETVHPLGQDVFVPGNIVLLHERRGVSMAVHVEHDSEYLNRISLVPNAASAHTCRTYINMLNQATTLSSATPQILERHWSHFAEADTCDRCQYPFSWYCPSDSSATVRLEKANCYCCGNLMCKKCCVSEGPVPKYGLLLPVPICDKCHLNRSNLIQN